MKSPVREELYPIRTVASLTGVKPVTLRAWERRYGLVSPRRAESGHRLYTRDDLQRLHGVVALLEQGVPIGRVARMLPETLAGDDEDVAPAAPERSVPWSGQIERVLAAVTRFDEAALHGIYSELLGLYPVDTVHEQVLLPVLRELGERWSRRPGGIAEEHFFSAYLRNKLAARLHHLSQSTHGPKLLLACLADDRHDLGLLMFSQRACAHGYRVVMLGAALPLAELPPSVATAGADALVLSMSVEPPARVLDAGLAELVRAVAIPVLVGGALSQSHRASIEAAGAGVLGASFSHALERLDATLARPRDLSAT